MPDPTPLPSTPAPSVPSIPSTPPAPSAFRLLLIYLFGSRDAILRIATTKHATLVSLVLVFSAGFAREYDGENLIAEPWHALRPLAASTATGTVLFLLIHTVTGAWRRSTDVPIPIEAYRRFMTCYWMTAPLALLYAIPYERFLSPADAVLANLWTLAFVAAWRVILITRVASVLYGTHIIPMFFVVMLFADAVAFAAFNFTPAPVLDVMGGIQHNERDAIVSSVAFMMLILTMLSSPVWILGVLASLAFLWTLPPRPPAAVPIRGWGTIAITSIVIWIIPLIIAQPEQFRRTRVMRAFDAGDIPAALAELSRHPEHAFPRRWELPPRMGYRERTPDLAEIARVIQSQPTAPWVTDHYAQKVGRQLREDLAYFAWSWSDTLHSVVTDEGTMYPSTTPTRITQTHLDQLAFVQAHDPTLTPTDHAAIDTIAAAIREALAAQTPDAPAPHPADPQWPGPTPSPSPPSPLPSSPSIP